MRIQHLPSWLKEVGPKEILQLQFENEGRLRLGSISECELDKWRCQHPKLIESDELRCEYNFLSKELIIKCMPLPTHDTLQLFFTQSLSFSLAQRFGYSQAEEMISVGSGTTFSGFTDDPSGASEKLPDAYAQLPDDKFPTVVCEAGWSEAYEQLVQDARLWLLHTSGQTHVVILLSFTEKIPKPKTTVLDDNITADSEKTPTDNVTADKTPADDVFTEETSDEHTILASINETTDLDDLAERLLNLNKENKLTQPLVGDLEANLYLYKASEGGGDIVETFATKLLPPPPIEDSSATKEFGITLEELFGASVPDGQNPSDEILFNLAKLQKRIETSIPRTERLRATRRAKKLLKSIVGLGGEETFAQTKRRRLDPIGLWK